MWCGVPHLPRKSPKVVQPHQYPPPVLSVVPARYRFDRTDLHRKNEPHNVQYPLLTNGDTATRTCMPKTEHGPLRQSTPCWVDNRWAYTLREARILSQVLPARERSPKLTGVRVCRPPDADQVPPKVSPKHQKQCMHQGYHSVRDRRVFRDV